MEVIIALILCHTLSYLHSVVNGGTVAGQDPNCNTISANKHPPVVAAYLEGLHDSFVLTTLTRVQTHLNEKRTIFLKCVAPYPITFKPSLNGQKGDYMDHFKRNARSRHSKEMELFIVSTFVEIEPLRNLNLKATCMSSCERNRFPNAMVIYTIQEHRHGTGGVATVVIAKVPAPQIVDDGSAEETTNNTQPSLPKSKRITGNYLDSFNLMIIAIGGVLTFFWLVWACSYCSSSSHMDPYEERRRGEVINLHQYDRRMAFV